MTSVRIDTQAFRAVPWHDADIFAIRLAQADDGAVACVVHVELHPDESRATLMALGLHTARLAICFREVRAVRLFVNGDTSQREWVDHWRVTPGTGPGPLRCHLVGTAGSTLDVEADEVWLGEVPG